MIYISLIFVYYIEICRNMVIVWVGRDCNSEHVNINWLEIVIFKLMLDLSFLFFLEILVLVWDCVGCRVSEPSLTFSLVFTFHVSAYRCIGWEYILLYNKLSQAFCNLWQKEYQYVCMMLGYSTYSVDPQHCIKGGWWEWISK